MAGGFLRSLLGADHQLCTADLVVLQALQSADDTIQAAGQDLRGVRLFQRDSATLDMARCTQTTYFDVAALEQRWQRVQQCLAYVMVHRRRKQPVGHVHVLPFLFGLCLQLLGRQDGYQAPSLRCQSVCNREGVREGDGVVDDFKRTTGNLRGFRNERVGREVSVEDVSGAEGFEEGRVVRGRGGDDWGEVGEASKLDDCCSVSDEHQFHELERGP